MKRTRSRSSGRPSVQATAAAPTGSKRQKGNKRSGAVKKATTAKVNQSSKSALIPFVVWHSNIEDNIYLVMMICIAYVLFHINWFKYQRSIFPFLYSSFINGNLLCFASDDDG